MPHLKKVGELQAVVDEGGVGVLRDAQRIQRWPAIDAVITGNIPAVKRYSITENTGVTLAPIDAKNGPWGELVVLSSYQ